jgi:hypothetical protein
LREPKDQRFFTDAIGTECPDRKDGVGRVIHPAFSPRVSVQ